ncbi:hypothetical protein [Nonomuraea sp. B19D2]|uniref:hypothetical protein n=1 Tax=Nonomuraea sp. B19D2 TaxID=3159561 RepID=UPI0032DA7373
MSTRMFSEDQLERLMLIDQAVSARESRAKSKTDEALIERATAGEACRLLLGVILPVPDDPAIPDEQIGGLLRNQIEMSKLREVVTEVWKKLPRDHGRLSALHVSYTSAPVHSPGADGDRLQGQYRHRGPDGGAGHLETAE